MNKTLLGTALIALSGTAFTSGCGILETLPTVEMPQIRFDSNSYVVQPGDTLDSVASRYKIDPDSLLSINSLQLAELIPGQRLVLLRDEEVASMAAMASRTSIGSADNSGTGNSSSIGASGVGQTVVLPNATQTVSSRTTTDQGVITTDVVLPPQGREEIVAVVDAPAGDALLDDEPPLFVADTELAPNPVNRPEGFETIVQTVSVPSAGTVEIVDAASPSPSKRITVDSGAGGWNWPVFGTITRDFDLREINRQGLDIDPGPDAAVQAAADGEVVYSGRDLASYGNLVILRHDNNFLSAYSKVGDIFVEENQKVKVGHVIASAGQSESGSNEVHFEIRRNGEPVNPIDYLPAR